MIHSMTAFARESLATGHGILTVELRSVNHRYLDCTFKLPDALRSLEHRLRTLAGAAMNRGKLDCLLRLQGHPSGDSALRINAERLEQLVAATDVVSRRIPGVRPPSALEVLQFPGICDAEDNFEEELQKSAEGLFRSTMDNLLAARQREGEKLAGLVLERLQQVASAVAATRTLLPTLMQQQRDRITARIGELDMQVDRNRLEQELVYLAQKADVDEELDRLDAHIGGCAVRWNKAGHAAGGWTS